MSATLSVTDRLAAEVAAHRLELDVAQRDAAARLDALGDALRAAQPGAMERLAAKFSWLPGSKPRSPVRGLYLWGGVGRGKTLLMDMFVDSLHAVPRAAQVRAERAHFYHFMRDVHAQLAAIKQRARPLDVVAQQFAARAQVICLDEFFVSDIADAMILAGLLEGLFDRGVTLVTTSNLPPQELYKDGLQRQRFLPAIDTLRRHVDVLHLDGGADYRLRQLEKAPTYLDSTDGATEAILADKFTALAAGLDRGPVKLTVEGRALQARRTGPGMVWFEFGELCDGPRSQNDYIELARLYHTLVISHVPLFAPGDDDLARRFIMLVDETYDRGVKLIVSAAAAPVLLYRGERLRFEFERAASRLIEMQTQAYLAGEHRP